MQILELPANTEALLQNLKSADAVTRNTALATLAHPEYHTAIPQLVAWLSTDEYIFYDEKEYYGTYNDSVKLHTEAARALHRIGVAAVPALLGDLHAHADEKNPLHVALLSECLSRNDSTLTTQLIHHHREVHRTSLKILNDEAPFDSWKASERRYHYYNRVAYLRTVVRPALARMQTIGSWTFLMRYATFGATEQARLIWHYRMRGWRIAPLVWLAVPIMFLLNVIFRLPTVLVRKAFFHTC